MKLMLVDDMERTLGIWVASEIEITEDAPAPVLSIAVGRQLARVVQAARDAQETLEQYRKSNPQ